MSSVRVSRRYAAPPEAVFDAFTDPARAGKFLFATPAGEMVRVDIDARPGGAFVIPERRAGEDIEQPGENIGGGGPGRPPPPAPTPLPRPGPPRSPGEGGKTIDHAGEYIEVERPRRLSFDFSVPKFSTQRTRVTIDIAPNGDDAAELTLTHEGVLDGWEEKTKAGWATILEALARVVSSGVS